MITGLPQWHSCILMLQLAYMSSTTPVASLAVLVSLIVCATTLSSSGAAAVRVGLTRIHWSRNLIWTQCAALRRRPVDSADMVLPVDSYMISYVISGSAVWCLAMRNHTDGEPSILGNYHQQNMHVLYDLCQETLSYCRLLRPIAERSDQIRELQIV
ncbi:hypothetical protein HU200_034399 [Digitaria exilis]|uniref:Xylanase inhibitor C-terminal domain-containing protein n=1 Tax=Digitaria exilis TaxID=1010633 RepID=A0A835BL06_9POAL|nr:hypothetical protein HU200_034399 [Digitaria exilis]